MEDSMKTKSYKKMAALSALGVLALALAFTLALAMDVSITNVNVDNFPGVHIFVRVLDDSGAHIIDLGSGNFQVRENGVLVNEAVEAQFGYMAVSLVMDASGSMAGNEQQVIDACSFFVNGLDPFDKGALIKFATYSSVSVPMTYDKGVLLDSIATYAVSGATDLWDAINLGIQEAYYEPEKKAVVTFTDGQDNQPGVFAAQLPGLAGPDITLYTIGIGDVEADSLEYVATQTGGFYLYMQTPSQLQQVLNDIRLDIDNLYDIFYVSPNPSPNGTTRELEVVCSFQAQSDWDTASYVAPLNLPPVITLSSATQAMLSIAQPSGQALNISCTIAGIVPIEDARIYYKTIGATYFTQAELVHGTGQDYYYNIPGSAVQNPGVYFYLQATDEGGNTITAPAFTPASLPLCISVLSNYPPVITYDAPGAWLTRRSLPVSLTVTDATNYVGAVKFYYRVPETFFYNEVEMAAVGNNTYECEILGDEINEEDDLEIFVAAWDNHDAIRYWYLSDAPYLLRIEDELGPTPPAVVLEPQNLPITIPVGGGTFYYTKVVINPINAFAECDTWADYILPSGAVQVIGQLDSSLVLSQGSSDEEARSQFVSGAMQPGSYLFRVHTGDYATQEVYFTDSFPFTKSAGDGGDSPGIADGFRIQEVFPNPFNAVTSLAFYLPQDGNVQAVVYNVFGQVVAKLADSYLEQGFHRLSWDASTAPTGTYFCRITSEQGTLTQRMMLVK
jgi:hypothetical protein